MFLAKPIGGLLRWFIKPKIDNTKPLLVFYHADDQLNTIASLMDEWSGNGNFEALMTRLRACQQELLSALVVVMNGMNPPGSGIFVCRDYQLKYPDDVREEVLGYYAPLWFGAECIAAGSIIADKEESSIKLRPSAIRLCKVIEKLRRMLRKQVFVADNCYTHEMVEVMTEFDKCWTEFELGYVSSWVKVKTPHQYNQQQDLVVIFSCAVLRALKVDNITQDMIDFYEPGLMYAIPRLGLLWGLRVEPGALAVPDTVTDDVLFYFHTAFEQVKALKTELMQLQDEEVEQLEKYICAFLHEEDQPPPWLRSASRQASEVTSPKGTRVSRVPSLSLVSMGSETVVAAIPPGTDPAINTDALPNNQSTALSSGTPSADASSANESIPQTVPQVAVESDAGTGNHGNAALQENGLPLVEPAEPAVTLSAAVFSLISRQGAGEARGSSGQLAGNMPFAHHGEQSDSRSQSLASTSATLPDTLSSPSRTHTPAWNMSPNPNARQTGAEATGESVEEEDQVGSFKEQYENVLRSGSIHSRDEVLHAHVRTQRTANRKGIKTGSESGDDSEGENGADMQRSASEGRSEKSGASRSSSEVTAGSRRSLDRIASEGEYVGPNSDHKGGQRKTSEEGKAGVKPKHPQQDTARVSCEHDVIGLVLNGAETVAVDEEMGGVTHGIMDTTEMQTDTSAGTGAHTNMKTENNNDAESNAITDTVNDRTLDAGVMIRDTTVTRTENIDRSKEAANEPAEDDVNDLSVYRRGSVGKVKSSRNRLSGSADRGGMHSHTQVLSPALERSSSSGSDININTNTIEDTESQADTTGEVTRTASTDLVSPGDSKRSRSPQEASDELYQRLFLQIAQIADHLQSGEYAKDVRAVLKTVFAMHMSEDTDDESDGSPDRAPAPVGDSSQPDQGEALGDEAEFPETNVYRDAKSGSSTNSTTNIRPVVATEDIEERFYGGMDADQASSARPSGDGGMPVSDACLMDTGHSGPGDARGRDNVGTPRSSGSNGDEAYSGVSPPGIAGVCETLGPALALSADLLGPSAMSPELQTPQALRGNSHGSAKGEIRDTSVVSPLKSTSRNADGSGSGSEQGSASAQRNRVHASRAAANRSLAHLETSPRLGERGPIGAANNSHNMSNMNTMCGPTQGLSALLPGGPNTPMRTMYLRPEWVNDEDVDQCARCDETFNWTRRRHHCRSCGGIFCGSCASNYVTIDRLAYTRPVRVCGDCYIRVRSLVLAQNNQNASP